MRTTGENRARSQQALRGVGKLVVRNYLERCAAQAIKSGREEVCLMSFQPHPLTREGEDDAGFEVSLSPAKEQGLA